MPRIIPVLDVLNGVVVRAVGGRRDEYRPIVSRLTDSTSPPEVARALLAATGGGELYVADLDAITGRAAPAAPRWLAEPGRRVWFDGGFRTAHQVRRVLGTPRLNPVLGSETVERPRMVTGIARATAFASVALSIDLRDGELVGDWRMWELAGPSDVLGLARRAVGLGFRTLIVLDLAMVGMSGGTGTVPICRAIRDAHPDVELIAGGGVRGRDDIIRLGDAGADGVLVASALHDGRLEM